MRRRRRRNEWIWTRVAFSDCCALNSLRIVSFPIPFHRFRAWKSIASHIRFSLSLSLLLLFCSVLEMKPHFQSNPMSTFASFNPHPPFLTWIPTHLFFFTLNPSIGSQVEGMCLFVDYWKIIKNRFKYF